MNPVRILIQGQEVPGKTVFLALTLLILFGVSSNAVFDCYKLISSTVPANSAPLDRFALLLDVLPLLLLFGIVGGYLIWRRWNRSRFPSIQGTDAVPPHKGIILALSIPSIPNPDGVGPRKLKPDEVVERIVQQIKGTPSEEVETLYTIRGIGQLFKGIYHHRKYLKHVWPLYTEDAAPYKECIQAFIDRFRSAGDFLKQVKIRDTDECCRLLEREDRPLMDELKSKLADIYHADNLAALDLTPSDIIVDVTGGTKVMTIGMAFGALDSAIDIQYVEQREAHDVILLKITPEAIMDKVSTYLMELSAKTGVPGR